LRSKLAAPEGRDHRHQLDEDLDVEGSVAGWRTEVGEVGR
jgi:hypothetical protein